jgi:hypothetical protein
MKWRLSFFSLEGSGSGLPGALPLTERERERERERDNGQEPNFII